MKKWIKACLIVLGVLVAVELLLYAFCIRINPLAVDKLVLCSYDGKTQKFYQAELTQEEIWKLAMLYNYHLAFPESIPQFDCPTECDRLEIYYDADTKMTIHTIPDDRFVMGGSAVSNDRLWKYIQELLAKYELPAW